MHHQLLIKGPLLQTEEVFGTTSSSFTAARSFLLFCLLHNQVIHNNNNNNNNNRIQRRYSRFFYNLLTAPRTVSNTFAQVAQVQLCANHVQHIERLSRASVMLRATWYEGTAQLLSLTELKSHLVELYFIG